MATRTAAAARSLDVSVSVSVSVMTPLLAIVLSVRCSGALGTPSRLRRSPTGKGDHPREHDHELGRSRLVRGATAPAAGRGVPDARLDGRGPGRGAGDLAALPPHRPHRPAEP